MGRVTITVLQGADRGRTFRDLATPLTIGREEGNTIQLNDERVSRCHLKIQQDNDRFVLTDLDSTNGTKVNGQECQLRILRFGDVINVGRSLVRVGSEQEIAQRMAALNPSGDLAAEADRTLSREHPAAGDHPSAFDFELNTGNPENQNSATRALSLMGMVEPPVIPEKLSPGQAAQLCEILEYLQGRLQPLIDGAQIDEGAAKVALPLASWQRLLDAQARLATLVRRVADPEWTD